MDEEDKRGCPEGLILVGSNGSEPICQEPGAGCPDGYTIIGSESGTLICRGDEVGDRLRVAPDGSVTIDTSAPFPGPMCLVTDSEGDVVELTPAVSEEACADRGGEYLEAGA